MAGRVLYAFLAMAASSLAQKPSACRTVLDVPCYTLRGTDTDWQLFKTGWTDVRKVKTTYVDALSRDGSHVARTEDTFWKGFSREGDVRKVASLYVAPRNQIITVDYRAGTIARREPLIWHDRPYRRSVKEDAACKSGIIHSGTDFRMEGTTTVAGISVVKWHRTLGNGGSEEEYLAPSLDCLPLKSYSVLRNALWLPTLIRSREASSVEFGEPNPELFNVPSGFREIEDPRRAFLVRYLQENGDRGALKSIR